MTRLLDPDSVLRQRIVEFVANGDFGFASGATGDGNFDRVWFREPLAPEDMVFENDVYLLTGAVAEKLSRDAFDDDGEDGTDDGDGAGDDDDLVDDGTDEAEEEEGGEDVAGEDADGTTTLRLVGTVPP